MYISYVLGMLPRRYGIIGHVEWMRSTCIIDCSLFFFFQAEDGIRDLTVTGVQTCALPILVRRWSCFSMRVKRRKTWMPFLFSPTLRAFVRLLRGSRATWTFPTIG